MPITKPIELKQLNYLVTYYEDIAQQCEIHRRVSEQTLAQLTINALRELQVIKLNETWR
jgi:hypothetical protein